jgi:PAS domain S-box-containing protein
MRAPLAYAIRIAVLAAAYIAAAWVGLHVDSVSGFATLVWAPTGIALVATVVYGVRICPFVALGAFAVNAAVGAPFLLAAAIAVGNTLEAVVAAVALRRLGFHRALDRQQDVVALAVIGGMASTAVAATFGVVSLELARLVQPMRGLDTWAAWWWGDLAGVLLVAPVIFTWVAPTRSAFLATRRQRIEAALLAICLTFLGGVVFCGWLPAWAHPSLWRPYMMIPLLLWAAIRFGPRGAATANFFTDAIAIGATAIEMGPFAGFSALHEGLLSLQIFMSTSALATLSVAAIVVERERSAAAARAADLLKTAILEAAPEAIVTLDRDDRVRDLNESAAALLRIDRSAALGNSAVGLIGPASEHDRLRRILDRQLDAESCERWTSTLVRRDRSEFPAEITVASVPLPIEGGPYVTCVIRDLTAQRAVERSLERSRDELEQRVEERTAQLRELNVDLTLREEQMRRAQGLAHVGSFVWDMKVGTLRCSDELHRILGLEPHSPIHYRDFLDRLDAEDRVRLGERLPDLARGGPLRFETRIARPDGAIRTILLEAEIEAGPSGEPTRLIGACQDVTERWEFERISARLGAMVESSTDAIIGKTLEGRIDSWNCGAALTYGYRAQEVLGQSMLMLVPTAHHEEVRRMFERARNGERIIPFEAIGRRKNGSLFDASVALSPVLDRSSQIIGVSAIVRDISEQKRSESAMKHSLAEKEVLLKEIHHRVKNNLQVVASLLNLQVSAGSSDEQRRALEESVLRIHSMALVHQLLYQSRDLASIDFSGYIRELVGRLGDSFAARESRITFAVSAPGIHLDIDTAVPCGLIVNELVSNSLRHAFPDGRAGHVAVSLGAQEHGFFILTVVDDGIGIPAEALRGGGSLGLQIVSMLAKQLRGAIEFTRLGGTRVQITFPHRAARSSSQAAANPAAPAALASPGQA